MENGSSAASAVLFAHDHITAGKTILKSIELRHDERKEAMFKVQTEDFINYVVAEWSNKMKQSVAIGYELLD